MHYKIYLPEKVGANPDHLKQAGLGVLLRDDDDGPMFSDLTGEGPDGKSGQIVSWGNATRSYLPESQEWVQGQCGDYWFGFELDSPPTCADLRRTKQIAGFESELGDGGVWRIPNVMSVPHSFVMKDGVPDREPMPDWKHIVDRGLWALEKTIQAIDIQDDPDGFGWSEQFLYLCEMLAINYRITPEIAGRLQLFNTQNIYQAIYHTTDVERIRDAIDEVKKKTVPVAA